MLQDGSALVTQRDEAVILHVRQGRAPRQVKALTDVYTVNEAGLMGLAADDAQSTIFAMYTASDGNRVVRMSWDGQRLGEPETILSGIPRADFHDGGRLAFGPDGLLYVGTGDAGSPSLAQDRDSLAGKILRIGPGGGIPSTNPVPGSAVYSWGHRNVQGLAFDEQGRLWASEFGSKDFDELNLIRAGGNYGWPDVEGPGGGPEFIDPRAWWSPTSIASPSGIAVQRGSVWVASLRGQTLWQVPFEGDSVGDPVPWLSDDVGRLRDVVAGPDGGLWLMTNNTDGRGNPADGDDRIVTVRLR